MIWKRLLPLCLSLLSCLFLLAGAAAAETNCEEGDGPLNTAKPTALTPDQIVQKFAAREAIFKEARNHYTYTQEVVVQTLDGDTVDGEYRQINDILYDDKGNRIEEVKFAPQPTLTRIMITKEDLDDFRNRLPFVMTTEDLPKYDVHYEGQQRVDEIDTYVFEVAPSTWTRTAGRATFRDASG